MATLISDELRWAADQIVNHCDYKSAVLSGLAPNRAHLDSGGFHCSIEDLKAHGNGGDFSNTRADDKGFNPRYGAAFDVSFSPADMVKAYGRVHAVWADHSDPRRKYVNAINGWDGSGDAVRLDFDANVAKYASPDHKWHDHGEMHRRYVRDPKAARAVVSIYKGESKAAWIAREEQPAAPTQGDDMTEAQMLAALASPAGQSVIARAAGSGVHNQKLGRSEVTIGQAVQSTNATATILAASAGKDLVDEQALADALMPLLSGTQLETMIRKAMTVEERLALAARLQS